MILPRLGLFRCTPKGGIPKIHLVVVDGDTRKSVCTRVALRNGQMMPPESELRCLGCINRGWTESSFAGDGSIKQRLGYVEDDEQGRTWADLLEEASLV